MADAPEAAANLFVEQVRKLVRVLRYGSREAVLALIGFLLFGAARCLKELKDLPFEIPKQVLLWTSVSLMVAGGLCLLVAVLQTWRKVSAPLAGGGEPRLPALKGASSFGSQDADLFARLGRDGELEHLRDWILDDQRPLVVLIGESGVGKTSLLRAGLAHVLKNDGLPVIYWEAMPAEPEASLLHAVRSAWGSRDGFPDFFSVLVTALAASPHAVVLDQLEQLSLEEHAAMFGLLREVLFTKPPYKSTWIVAFRREYAATWIDFELTLPDHALARIEKLSIQRFKPSTARKVVAVLAEEAGLPIDHKVVGELVDGLAGAGGVSPVDIGITLLGLGELAGEDSRVSFSLEDFRASGAQTGLLTRYLERVLSQFTDTEKSEVLLALLSLIDLEKDQRLAEGMELAALEKTARPVSPGRFAAALKYLASSKARVLENVAAPSAEPRYRLIHERLISAVRALTGVLLAEAHRAGMLLERAYRDWSRERRRKYLLSGRDLRRVVRSLGQFTWGDDEPGKREFLKKSKRQRWMVRALSAGACAVLLSLGFWLRFSLEKRGLESELAAWRLPLDLGERLNQLDELEVSGITSVEWLGKAVKLRTLTIRKSQLKTLDGLPSGIRSLSIVESEIREVRNLPACLQALDLSGTPIFSLSGLPPTLRSLGLYGSQLSSLSGLPPKLQSLNLSGSRLSSLSGLPPTLQSLNLSGSQLSSLAGLPRTLRALDLSGAKLSDLSGLPPTLQSLDLADAELSSLLGLPPTLQSLDLYHVDRSSLSGLSPTLQSLGLGGFVDLSTLPSLPPTLRSLDLSGSHLSSSLSGLPPTLQSLDLTGSQLSNLSGLPPTLQSLNLSASQLSSLSGLPPTLQALDLSHLSMPQLSDLSGLPRALQSLNLAGFQFSLSGLPPTLQSLSLSDIQLPSLAGLPPNLQVLDLSNTGLTNLMGLPIRLQWLDLSKTHISDLVGLPASITSLNVAWTGIRRLERLPPHLEELTLNRSQVETLKGLPKSVKVLRFVG